MFEKDARYQLSYYGQGTSRQDGQLIPNGIGSFRETQKNASFQITAQSIDGNPVSDLIVEKFIPNFKLPELY